MSVPYVHMGVGLSTGACQTYEESQLWRKLTQFQIYSSRSKKHRWYFTAGLCAEDVFLPFITIIL